jgi:hypothetical protein
MLQPCARQFRERSPCRVTTGCSDRSGNGNGGERRDIGEFHRDEPDSCDDHDGKYFGRRLTVGPRVRLSRLDTSCRSDDFHAESEHGIGRIGKLGGDGALGQLLEYAYFGKRDPGDPELVIIGRGHPSKSLREYVQYLRLEFGLDLKYRRYELGSRRFSL